MNGGHNEHLHFTIDECMGLKNHLQKSTYGCFLPKFVWLVELTLDSEKLCVPTSSIP